MTLPTSCMMHRVVLARRFQCRVPLVAPRILGTTAAYISASGSCRVSNRHAVASRQLPCPPSEPSISTTAPICGRLSLDQGFSAPGKRLFSTAVAPEYADEDEDNMYENPSAPTIEYSSNERMPRLQALRERLRSEKDQPGRGINQNSQLSLHPIENDPARTVEEPTIEYSTDMANHNMLTDTHGRHHNYLRISLSERCNLRCQYCMPPEGVPLSPKSKLLTDDEITRLVQLFVKNGVNKVRLTGGEPLLRPNLVALVRSISETLAKSGNVSGDGGLVGITTNGISLSRKIDDLVDAGLTSVNISLDTLQPERFLEVTRRNGLDQVMRAIESCIRAFRRRYGDVRVGPHGTGGSRVKINFVVMKGFNDDELADFARMADDRFGGDVDVRYIEWMPFNDNGWSASRFLSYKDIMARMAREGMPLERIGDGPNDTTKWWTVASPDRDPDRARKARVGFITSMSDHFCGSCNRLRITADGMIKVCLFGSNEKEVSLRDIMRSPLHEDLRLQEAKLAHVIHAAVQRKNFALGGHGSAENIAKAANNRPMTLIGG